MEFQKEVQMLKARLNQLMQKQNTRRSKINLARDNFHKAINELLRVSTLIGGYEDTKNLIVDIQNYPNTLNSIIWEAQEINDITFRLKNLYQINSITKENN